MNSLLGTAVITGASAGIGRVYAARLALFAGSRSGKPATRYLAAAGTVTGE